MVDKKAQLKIQQMAFLLMAVTLFFVLAGLFILIFKFSGLKDAATEIEERNAMLLVTKIANSPEFSCGEAFDSKRTNCVDADKIMMLKNNINKYDDFWGVSNIEIRKIYPAEDDKLCTNGNYPNCNIIRLREEISSADKWNFVALCRKKQTDGGPQNKCELAKIMIYE